MRQSHCWLRWSILCFTMQLPPAARACQAQARSGQPADHVSESMHTGTSLKMIKFSENFPKLSAYTLSKPNKMRLLAVQGISVVVNKPLWFLSWKTHSFLLTAWITTWEHWIHAKHKPSQFRPDHTLFLEFFWHIFLHGIISRCPGHPYKPTSPYFIS